MYIYYRQCYRALKPAAVFPIEVELGINPDVSKRYYYSATEEPGDASTAAATDSKTKEDTPSKDETLPAVDDLLLDLGLTDPGSEATAISAPPLPPMETGGSEHQLEAKSTPPTALLGSEQQ